MRSVLIKSLAKAENILLGLLVICALGYLVVYVIMACFRIPYPYELEWMEGGMVDHVVRILNGQKLYVEPSLGFIPFIYPPVYFYLSGALSKVFGVGFVVPRLLSFISSLGCFYIIFLIVRRKTGSLTWGIVAAGLFAASFRIGGAWFDIARIDSLYLLLSLLAIYLVMFGNSRESAVLSAVFISLAFLTKQTALAVVVPLVLYYILLNRQHLVWFIVIAGTIMGGGTLLLNMAHDGWYLYYVFELPSRHPIYNSMFVTFWTDDMFPQVPIALAAAILLVIRFPLRMTWRLWIVWIFLMIAMMGGSLIGRAHAGGYLNVLIPAYAVISIVFALVAHGALYRLQALSKNPRRYLSICLHLGCLAQFYLLRYDPFTQVPTAEDQVAGRQMLENIADIEGDVIFPFHGYYSTMIGKSAWVHQMAIIDVVDAGEKEQYDKLRNELRRAVVERKFGAIVIDGSWHDDIIHEYYVKDRKIFDSDSVFFPVTGCRTRPAIVLVPKNADSRGLERSL